MSADPFRSSGADAEAASWVVRLQAPDRRPGLEPAFRRWIDSDPSHAAAFARATEVWEELGGARHHLAPRGGRLRMTVSMGAALAAGVAAVAVFVAVEAHAPTQVYATMHGEQRRLRLSDGSQITLNTDSEVQVRYQHRQRTLVLKRGEALFEVAKNPSRPFVVQAGDRRVRALGTVFEVDREGGDLTVTLLEGKVAIGAASLLQRLGRTNGPPVTLDPGERWSASHRQVVRLDADGLEQSTAWLHRQIVLSDATLADAVAEVNRYAHVPLTVDAASSSKRVSGIFAADATESFTRMVAGLYGLDVERRPDEIRLTTPR